MPPQETEPAAPGAVNGGYARPGSRHKRHLPWVARRGFHDERRKQQRWAGTRHVLLRRCTGAGERARFTAWLQPAQRQSWAVRLRARLHRCGRCATPPAQTQQACVQSKCQSQPAQSWRARTVAAALQEQRVRRCRRRRRSRLALAGRRQCAPGRQRCLCVQRQACRPVPMWVCRQEAGARQAPPVPWPQRGRWPERPCAAAPAGCARPEHHCCYHNLRSRCRH